MAEINPKWDEYILWLATPEHERGLISNEEQWAKSNGFADARTTRRWKKNPDFIARQKTLTSSMVSKVGAVAVFEDDQVEMDSEERDYKVVKSKLVQSAKEGNLKAQELYMKTYGKTWVDEEQAARTSDFSNMELPMLVSRALASLAPDDLVDALRNIGWVAYNPSEKGE